MTVQTWDETVIAGKLFAVLTSDSQSVLSELRGFKSLSIDHGALRIEMADGRKFDVLVRQA